MTKGEGRGGRGVQFMKTKTCRRGLMEKKGSPFQTFGVNEEHKLCAFLKVLLIS